MKYRLLLGVIIGTIWLGDRSGPVYAAQAVPAPKLSLVSGDKVVFEEEGGRYVAHILVRNSGSAAGDAVVALFDTRGIAVSATATGSLAAGSVTPLPVAVERFGDARRGRIVIDTADTGDEPVVVPFEVHVRRDGVLWSVVLGSLAVALLVVACRWKTLGSAGVSCLDREVPVDTQWSFSASWASNVTALGALVGTVLGTSAALSEALGPFSSSEFTALNLFWGGLVLLAPVAYAAARTTADGKVRGTYGGLLLAGAVTSWAVVGELATIGGVVITAADDGWVRAALAAAVVLAVVLVVIYAYRSIGLTMQSKRDGEMQALAAPARGAKAPPAPPAPVVYVAAQRSGAAIL